MKKVHVENSDVTINSLVSMSTEDIQDLQDMVTLELKRRGVVSSTIATDLPEYAIDSGLVSRKDYADGYIGSGVLSWEGTKYDVTADGETINYVVQP